MFTRRAIVKKTGWLAAAMLFNKTAGSAPKVDPPGFYMPEESAPHQRTWMAYGAKPSIWGQRLLPDVRRNLRNLANRIAEYEPVTMLVNPAEATALKKGISSAVETVECPLDDLWIRDSGPTFVIGSSGVKAAVDFNFNGWGNKQTHTADSRVAAVVATLAGVNIQSSTLCLEGGSIETDGAGTAIISESSVIIDNRNPGVTKSMVAEELQRLLGFKKIIWIPGIRGYDITDGHTDFYARFVKPGLVIAAYDPDPASFDHDVTRSHLARLKTATDASGRKLDVLKLTAPEIIRPKYRSNDFAAGYLGYYVCNHAVFLQQFGDTKADDAARGLLQEVFPKRKIEPIAVDAIAAGGGSIHCTTQQEPKT